MLVSHYWVVLHYLFLRTPGAGYYLIHYIVHVPRVVELNIAFHRNIRKFKQAITRKEDYF